MLPSGPAKRRASRNHPPCTKQRSTRAALDFRRWEHLGRSKRVFFSRMLRSSINFGKGGKGGMGKFGGGKGGKGKGKGRRRTHAHPAFEPPANLEGARQCSRLHAACILGNVSVRTDPSSLSKSNIDEVSRILLNHNIHAYFFARWLVTPWRVAQLGPQKGPWVGPPQGLRPPLNLLFSISHGHWQ